MRRSKKFFLLIPVLLLIAVGVFLVSTKAPKLTQSNACTTNDLTGLYDYAAQTAMFEGQEVPSPKFARTIDYAPTAVLGEAVSPERWIEVDISEQKLKAWDGTNLFLETPISSGLPGTPTPLGEFHIWIKLRYTKMEGGRGRYYYNLPNVPFTMFFQNDKVPNWRGYGLHGTYWHSDFGNPRSHGCVNLPTPIAEKLYYWVGPTLPEGKRMVYASAENPGTRVVIHE